MQAAHADVSIRKDKGQHIEVAAAFSKIQLNFTQVRVYAICVGYNPIKSRPSPSTWPNIVRKI